MSQESVIQEIREERLRQDQKWGADRNLHPETWLRIIGEEYGEACAGVEEGLVNGDWTNYRYELVQTAAAAIAAIESCGHHHWGANP